MQPHFHGTMGLPASHSSFDQHYYERRRLDDARNRLSEWAEALEAKEAQLHKLTRQLERCQVEMTRQQKELNTRDEALRKRVAVLNEADHAGAAVSKAALENSAAAAIQRWLKQRLAIRKAKETADSLRKIRELEQRLELALGRFEEEGSVLLLEDTLTKLLESADGIATGKRPAILRQRRKAFVRRVMATLDNPHFDHDEAMSVSSGSDS